MENLFVNIQKYVPRKDRNPKEDFFLEILAFFLDNDKILLSKFVKVCGVNTGRIKKYEIRTQVKYEKYGRPDIEIIINDSVFIIIENKIDSTQRYNQLKDYLKVAQKKKYRHSYVVYLTKYYEDVDEKIRKRINHIYWCDVYKIFKEYKTKNKIIDCLIPQFIGLMEEEGMEPFKKITKGMIEGYKNIDNIQVLFKQIMDEMEKRFEVKRNKKVTDFSWDWKFDLKFKFKNKFNFSINFDGNFSLFMLIKMV